MNYSDVLANARECIGKYCKACPVCNGVACKNQIPGPGAKGVGDTAIRNYNKWADIRVNMDTLCENSTPDTHVELFGRSFKYPFFAGPVGAVNCWVSVKQFSKNDTATACQDWLRSTRLGRGSIKSHVRTVKVLGMGLFAFQERIHLWKGVTH